MYVKLGSPARYLGILDTRFLTESEGAHLGGVGILGVTNPGREDRRLLKDD